MSRRSNRYSLALVLLLSGNAWALGLGEIRLDSALNAPMRAQIELLSATPEELENLQVGLASQETFERYGLDRPYYLQDLRFEVVESGSSNYISVTSTKPITEPFLTFLVEAMWSRGRLLREYTVLLDPPTFAPAPVEETQPAVTAPQRSAPADSGRIERQAEPLPMPAAETPAARPRPIPAPAPRSEPEPAPEPKPQAGEPDLPYDTASGEDYLVQPRETLWGIASRFRPDFRLTMNQTMLAIYEANPEAFGGNINILRAGARLRLPSADDIYRIDRAYALNEVVRPPPQRQRKSLQRRPARVCSSCHLMKSPLDSALARKCPTTRQRRPKSRTSRCASRRLWIASPNSKPRTCHSSSRSSKFGITSWRCCARNLPRFAASSTSRRASSHLATKP
jgi:pilus assembly protein FimV